MKSIKHKKVCTILNYTEHFLILASTIAGCISISVFASLLDIPVGITSSAIALEICAIAAGIKKYKSIIKKKKNKHNKTILSAKYKLNSIEVLISKVLIDSNISQDEFNKYSIIMISAIGLNICVITAKIQKYKSITKKKKKKHNEIALLAKTNLDFIKGSILGL